MKRLMMGVMMGAVMSGCGIEAVSNDEAQDLLGPSHACDTPEAYGNGQHAGSKACSPIAELHVQAVVQTDPAAADENAEDFGIFVHYTTPITSGPYVYTGVKRGFTDVSQVGNQTWSVQANKWIGHALTESWQTDSKWKPFSALNAFSNTNGNEEVFQPALVTTGAFAGLVMPSSNGQLVRLDPATGAQLGAINPLAGTVFDGDPLAIVNSGISVRDDGTIAYTVVAWQSGGPLNTAPRGSWLVLARPDGSVTAQPFGSFAGGAVHPVGDQCLEPLIFKPVPRHFLPETPDEAPFTDGCTGIEPTINATPAFGTAGDVIVVGGDAHALWNSYVIDVDATTMAVRWSTQLINYSQDGCGVNIPFDTGNLCPSGTHLGVEPFFNTLPPAIRADILSSSPVVAPDGNVFIGVYGNDGQLDNFDGRVVEISSTGKILGSKRGGFNITPAIRRTGLGVHDYELLADDDRFDNAGLGPNLVPAVAHVNPNGMVTTSRFVAALDPNAIANDYLDEQPAVDTMGNTYNLNAAGRVDKISPTGTLLSSVNLGFSVEPLEQTLSWGTDGEGQPVLYVPFGGFMFALGTSQMSGPLPVFGASDHVAPASKAVTSHRGHR